MRKLFFFPIMSILLLTIVLVMLLLKIGFYKSSYNVVINNRTIELEIPKYSYSKIQGDGYFQFKTLNSTKTIKKNRETYLNNLFEQNCGTNENNYYYDKKNNITIYDYMINNNLISKTIIFKYYIGNYCNDKEMEKIEQELIDLNFSLQFTPNDKCSFEKMNEDNIYIYCSDKTKILFQNETMLLKEALLEKRVSIEKLIRKLEISSRYAEGIEKKYNNDIFYSDYNYRMIVCNLNNEQEKYIVGDLNLKYSESICENIDNTN
ncbi:MAG: hypothetical protein WDA12_03740 [Bacilli bacterium]